MRIVICGNYGATNLGDEAILTSIIKSVRDTFNDPKITVLSANPRKTAKHHKVNSACFLPTGLRSALKFPLTIGRTLYHIARADIFILGGGGLFTDEKPQAILIWALHAATAYVFKKPVYMYAQSVGPLNTKWARRLVSRVFKKAKMITVRDQESKDLLDLLDIGQKVTVTADPALLLDTSRIIPNIEKKYMILNLRPWPNLQFEIMNQYAKWVKEKYGFNVKLVPFQKLKDDDSKILKKIQGDLLNFNENLDEILALFKGAEFVVGMRLHSLIFAHMVRKPMIGLIYSQKVASFLESVNGTGIELANLKLEKLQKLTEEIEGCKTKYHQKKLKEKARINQELLYNFLA